MVQRATALTINDVSVLFPWPKASDPGKLLLGTDVGEKGPLVPEMVLLALPEDDQEMFMTEPLQAVAVRFDPCAPKVTPTEADCHAQIRVVYSPFEHGRSPIDENLHGIYSLTKEEFRAVVKELRTLRAKENAPDAADLPLSVNPVIERQGLDGEYATTIMGLVKKYAGEENLVKLAMFNTRISNEEWSFAIVNVNGETAARETIPTLTVDVQTVFASFGPLNDVIPEATSSDNVIPLLDIVNSRATSLDAGGKASLEAALRVENPTIHTVLNMDCASCHLAPMLIAEAEKQFDLDVAGSPNKYDSNAANLDVPDQAILSQTTLQAFSYHAGAPSINQRVVNESAEVVNHINTRIPAE